MPTRYRKSVKLAPGVKLNIGKKGISSVSFGGKYMRQAIGTSGRRTTSAGIPGTGLSVYKTSGQRRSSAPPQVPAPPKPGIFAKPVEKRFHEGLEAYRRGDWAKAASAFGQAIEASPAHPSPHLFYALVAIAQGQHADALGRLEWIVQNANLPDDLMVRYARGMVMQIGITDRVVVSADLEAAGPALLLAELYQRSDRTEDAIGLMQQLHEANPNDQAITLSLAELLFEDGDDDGVVETAAGVSNDSDVGGVAAFSVSRAGRAPLPRCPGRSATVSSVRRG